MNYAYRLFAYDAFILIDITDDIRTPQKLYRGLMGIV